MDKMNEKYGLFTAITMIVGIVIGSGIFFKSDNILLATNGSVKLGILAFVIAAFTIIFGSITISELASRTNTPGGIVTYADEFINEKVASGFGWFQTFLYFPTLIVIISWVVGIFICSLFGFDGALELQIAIGTLYMFFIFTLNIVSAKIGGYFQNIATIIKLIPLFLIAILGIIFGDPTPLFVNDTVKGLHAASLIAALGPIAFSFDGWVVSTSISHEIRHSKRNLPLALIIAPIFILMIYLAYFIGINALIGPDKVIALGDNHINAVAGKFLGPTGAKAILIFVIISVMGSVNGLVLGYVRMPYALALKNMIPNPKSFKTVNGKLGIPVNSALLAFFISLIWMGIHYVTTKYNLLRNSDISEISIVISYALYTLLYFKVFSLYRKKIITSKIKGMAIPFMATVGSCIIFLVGVQNPLFIIYASFCLIITLAGYFYKARINKD